MADYDWRLSVDGEPLHVHAHPNAATAALQIRLNGESTPVQVKRGLLRSEYRFRIRGHDAVIEMRTTLRDYLYSLYVDGEPAPGNPPLPPHTPWYGWLVVTLLLPLALSSLFVPWLPAMAALFLAGGGGGLALRVSRNQGVQSWVRGGVCVGAFLVPWLVLLAGILVAMA